MTDRIVELIKEYGCNPDEFDPYKVANEIRELAKAELEKDLAIQRDEEDYFIHLANLYEQKNKHLAL